MTDDTYEKFRRLVLEYEDEGLSHEQTYETLEVNHRDLVDAFVDAERSRLVKQAIRQIAGQARRLRTHHTRFAAAKDRVRAGESILRANFGGKPLGDMTKRDLLDEAAARERVAHTHLEVARVLRVIARKVPAGKTVADVFSPARVADLFGNIGLEEVTA